MSKKVKLTASSWHDISFWYEKVFNDIEDYFPGDEVPTDRELEDFAYDELVPDFIHEAIEVDVEVFDE